MKTLILSFIVLFSGWVCYQVSLFVLNIAGFPGALVAWGTSAYKERQSLAGHLRFALGVIVSLIGQSYVYLAWVAAVVIYTKHESPAVFAPVIWPVAFVASFFPIYFCAAAGIAEASSGQSEWNAQVMAILVSQVLAVIGFFIFAFFPSVITLGWPWVHYVLHWLKWT
jgi:hypothetical protein